jgi:hypothetical protein
MVWLWVPHHTSAESPDTATEATAFSGSIWVSLPRKIPFPGNRDRQWRRLVIGHWPIQSLTTRFMGWNDFGLVQLSDITNGVSDARGGPVPKICNRVPSHGPTGPAKGKPTNLGSPGGAVASLRQAY